MNILHRFSLKARLIFVAASFSTLLIAVGGMGIFAMKKGENDLHWLYGDDLIPSIELSHVLEHMESARAQVLLSLQHDPTSQLAKMHDHELSLHLDIIADELEKVSRLWNQY